MKKCLTSSSAFVVALLMVFGLTTSTNDCQSYAQDECVFTDVCDHKYKDAIQYVKEQGIIGGYKDGSYKPDKEINRAEFTKIIMASSFSEESITGSYCFTDVNNEWFAQYICSAKNEGIINGYSDGSFRPNNLVNLVEALKIIWEATGVDIPEAEGEWYQKYFDASDQVGLLDTIGRDPSHLLTRGEMAEIVYISKTLEDDTDNNNSTTTNITDNNTTTTNTELPPPFVTESGGVNIAWTDLQYHLFYNGEDMGHGATPKLSDGNLAYLRPQGNGTTCYYYDTCDVILNEENLGEGASISLSGDNIAFHRDMGDNDFHVFYNGEDLGKGTNPVLSGDNIAYFDENRNIIYNGTNLGKGESYMLSGDLLVYSYYDSNESQRYIYVNGKKVDKVANFAVGGGSYIYTNMNENNLYNVFVNGELAGEANYSTEISVDGDNYAFVKRVDSETHVVYNGNDMGKGTKPVVDGDDFAYTNDEDDVAIFNGEEVSNCYAVKITNGNSVCNARPTSNPAMHVYLNNEDVGVGQSFYVESE